MIKLPFSCQQHFTNLYFLNNELKFSATFHHQNPQKTNIWETPKEICINKTSPQIKSTFSKFFLRWRKSQWSESYLLTRVVKMRIKQSHAKSLSRFHVTWTQIFLPVFLFSLFSQDPFAGVKFSFVLTNLNKIISVRSHCHVEYLSNCQ